MRHKLTRADAVGSAPYDSIKWAFEQHLMEVDNNLFNLAILHGNEDCPSKIEFWKEENPQVGTPAAYTWTNPDC